MKFGDQSGLEEYISMDEDEDEDILDNTTLLLDQLEQPSINVSHPLDQKSWKSVEVQLKTGWQRFTVSSSGLCSQLVLIGARLAMPSL